MRILWLIVRCSYERNIRIRKHGWVLKHTRYRHRTGLSWPPFDTPPQPPGTIISWYQPAENGECSGVVRLSAVALLSFLTTFGLGRWFEPKANSAEADHLDEARRWLVEATTAYGEKDYTKAAELYLRAINAGYTVPSVPYNAACCFARLGQADDAFQYLDLAFRGGWSDVDHLKSDADLESLHSDKRWGETVDRCAANREKIRKSMANPDLYAELMKRMKTDQEARSAEPPNVFQLMLVDWDNTTWMKQVIEKHGWPGRAMVGRDGAQAARLLVQHADRDSAFQRRCLDLLTQAYEKGDASADQVAYLTDRVLLAEGKPQVYGTQFETVNGKLQPRPIENEAEVDKRREAMGLGPLAVYAEQIRTHYPP